MMNHILFRVRTPTPEPDDTPLCSKDDMEGLETNSKEKELSKEGDVNEDKNGNAGEPLKLDRQNSINSSEGANEVSKSTKDKENFVYKMPLYEPLVVASNGAERAMRIPEPLPSTFNPEFFNKTGKVCVIGPDCHSYITYA